MSELYTSSRLRLFRECMRKHHFRYDLRVSTPSTSKMDFGTHGHSVLESYYRQWQRGGDKLGNALADLQQLPIDPVDAAKLQALIVAYDLRWGAEPWDVLDVECEFRYELDGYLIGGKIDAIIRDRRDERVYLVEHKTTGADASIGSIYWERLAVDTQVSIYVDGGTILGHDIAGCVYDVLKRPSHDLKMATPVEARRMTQGRGCKTCGGSGGGKGGIVQGRGYLEVVFASEVKRPECVDCRGTGWKCDAAGVPQAPHLDARQRDRDETIAEFSERVAYEVASDVDSYLMRGTVVRLDSELPRMRDELIQQIRTIELTQAARLYTPNHDACTKFGSMCSFFDACAGRESIDNALRYPRNDTAHPELVVVAV